MQLSARLHLAKTQSLRQNEAMTKRLFLVFFFIPAILTAVCGVHATVPDPAGAYTLENSKRLVPRSLSGRIICRNDPINLYDPDGRFDISRWWHNLFRKNKEEMEEEKAEDVSESIKWKKEQAKTAGVDTGANPNNLDGEEACKDLVTKLSVDVGMVVVGGGVLDDAIEGAVNEIKLSKAAQKSLGKLNILKDLDAAKAILSRGGNASNIRKALGNKLMGKTVGEIANMAAAGDNAAKSALKIIKQASKKGQIY